MIQSHEGPAFLILRARSWADMLAQPWSTPMACRICWTSSHCQCSIWPDIHNATQSCHHRCQWGWEMRDHDDIPILSEASTFLTHSIPVWFVMGLCTAPPLVVMTFHLPSSFGWMHSRLRCRWSGFWRHTLTLWGSDHVGQLCIQLRGSSESMGPLFQSPTRHLGSHMWEPIAQGQCPSWDWWQGSSYLFT